MFLKQNGSRLIFSIIQLRVRFFKFIYFQSPPRDAFGQTAQFVYFNFANFTDDPTVPPGLCQIHFFYTPDYDQQALLDALRAEYGPEAEEYVRYSSIDGEAQTWVDNEQLKYWFPKTTLAGTLSDAEQSALREAYLSELSDEAAANYINAEPAGSVVWAENYFDAFSLWRGYT